MIKTETTKLIVKNCDICNKEENITKVDIMDKVSNIDKVLCKEHREEFKEWIRTKYPDILKYGCQYKFLSNFINEVKNG